MVAFPSKFVGAVLAALTVSTAALAQSYYDDQACRQFAALHQVRLLIAIGVRPPQGITHQVASA